MMSILTREEQRETGYIKGGDEDVNRERGGLKMLALNTGVIPRQAEDKPN